MRQIILFVSCLVFFSVLHVKAAEPNYVRSTVINVDGAGNDVVSTEYSDGLGRGIQSKLQLSSGRARVVSTFYDDAGRPYLSTKPFIDKTENPNTLFTPGDFAEINGTLNDSTNYASFITSGDNAYAYSETEYHDDPLGRVKRAGAPGEDYHLGSDQFTASWSFGVTINTVEEPYDFQIELASGGPEITVVVKVQNGFISEIDSNGVTGIKSLILDGFYAYLLDNPIADSDHFLTVARDPDDKLSQELKDLFGNTISTRSGALSSPVSASYSHDILGNLLSETAPKNGSAILISDSRYEYNTLNQLIRKESPDGAIERMVYNDDGSLKSKISYVLNGTVEVPKKTLEYEYDELGRLTAVKMPYRNDAPLYFLKYYHDTPENLMSEAEEFGIPFDAYSNLENTHGRLVAEVAFNRLDGLRFYTSKTSYVVDLYSYTDEGNVKTKYKVIPGLPLQTIEYTYDNHGKIQTEKFNCGSTVSKKYYKYDADGNLYAIAHGDGANDTVSSANDVVSYKYDFLGKFDTTYFSRISSGNMLRRTYDMRARMKVSSFNGSNNFHQELDYKGEVGDWSFNGNIRKSEITYTQGATVAAYLQNYTYDTLNRLISVETRTPSSVTPLPEFGASYQYDQAGRFTSKVEGTTSINNSYDYYKDNTRATSRLKKAKSGTGLYLYDFRGNMVIDSGKNMVVHYDWRDMPTRFCFYSSLPVGTENVKKIQPDNYGTITINDIAHAGKDPTAYVDWLCEKGEVTLLSSVQMLYDAAGKRVLKIAK